MISINEAEIACLELALVIMHHADRAGIECSPETAVRIATDEMSDEMNYSTGMTNHDLDQLIARFTHEPHFES